ncbi:uncharacterized protein WCC33_013033 [Rhinophrynus dorsalis]
MKAIALCVVFLIFLIQVAKPEDDKGTGLECYVCNSVINCTVKSGTQRCAPGLDTCQKTYTMIVDCDESDEKNKDDSEASKCMKVWERFCTTAEKCEKEKKNNKVRKTGCCSKSKCNA